MGGEDGRNLKLASYLLENRWNYFSLLTRLTEIVFWCTENCNLAFVK